MLGIRLDVETERRLTALARRTGRPKSQIAREAIRLHVERNDVVARARREWAALNESERGDAEIDDILGFSTDHASDVP